MDKVHSPNFLQEHCGAPRSTPRLLSFRKESNQRFAKEEVSSLETPLRGTSPRELRLAKFSPPICSASKQISGFASTTSGSRVLLSSVPSADTVGFQKGLAPFVGGVGTKRSRLNLCLLSFHKKVGAGVGRVGPQSFSQRVRRRSSAPSHACADKRNRLTECAGAGLDHAKRKDSEKETLFPSHARYACGSSSRR